MPVALDTLSHSITLHILVPGQRCPDEQVEARAEIQPRFSLPNLGRYLDIVSPNKWAPFSNLHQGTICASISQI